jgi:hypothetical protein
MAYIFIQLIAKILKNGHKAFLLIDDFWFRLSGWTQTAWLK